MKYPPPPPERGPVTVATVATVTDTGIEYIPHAERELSVKPRRTGYKHREIIAVYRGVGTLEDRTIVHNLPVFAATAAPYLWITPDPGWLLDTMRDRFLDDPAWNYQLMQSDATSTGGMQTVRLVRFGIRVAGRRHQAMHMVWTPQDIMRDSGRLELPGDTAGLLRFAQDIRDWLQENDLPIPSTLTGVAAALLRDKRFYPEPRGRVPAATNERVREFLPGVHTESHVKPGEHFRQVVALDQTRAYHRTVQSIPLPDSTTLYARGYFGDPDTGPLWLDETDRQFEHALTMPGLLCLRVVSRRTKAREHRPPALDFTGEQRVYVWSSEVSLVRETARITGIYAAWTSHTVDTGLPKYGAWCEQQIIAATPYRQKWLKPTLHAAYGLLGAQKRSFRTGYRIARGKRTTWLLGAREVRVAAIEFPATHPPTTNVAALGVIQAAIRGKTIAMANVLRAAGMRVTHLHADGLHADGNLPLIDESEWRVEPRDDLTYWDNVSWTSEQGDVLPGRDLRQRIEHRRHRNAIMGAARKPARHR